MLLVIAREISVSGTEILLIHEILEMSAHEGLCFFRGHVASKLSAARRIRPMPTIAGMRDFAIVFVHLIVTLARLARPGGLRSVVAESVLVRHQLLILNRGRKRAPNLRATDRIIAGLCTLFLRPARALRSAIVLKSSTLLHLQGVLRKGKYRMLFSPRRRRQKPGPKGPNKDLIEAVVAMKRLVALRALIRSRGDTALEILALRQQVAVLKR
jgi:hypothetical protein